MVNKDWLYRKILQNIGLNTLHQELLMKKKPNDFIILIKKEYSKFDALYESDNIAETTQQTSHNRTTVMAPETTVTSRPTSDMPQTTDYATNDTFNSSNIATSRVTQLNNTTKHVDVTSSGDISDINEPIDDEPLIVDIFSGESSADHSGNEPLLVVTQKTTTLSTPETSLEIMTQRAETTPFIPELTETDEPNFDDTPVIIVEPLIIVEPQTFESSVEIESSVNYDDNTCNCDQSVLQMINNPQSLLMNTLTKMIRRQVEDGVRQEINQQLVKYTDLVRLIPFCLHL